VRVPPDLTSLFDVLFIVIFAALIRAAAVQQAAAAPEPTPPPPPPVELAPTELHVRALAELDKQLAARPPVVVRISGRAITMIEAGTAMIGLGDQALLDDNPDPDIALAYLGDRSPAQRVCAIIAYHLKVPDLAQYLVIFAPDRRLVDLPHALYEGLRRDIERCLFDQKGLAVLVDPSVDIK
jgi:hypothetical protein